MIINFSFSSRESYFLWSNKSRNKFSAAELGKKSNFNRRTHLLLQRFIFFFKDCRESSSEAAQRNICEIASYAVSSDGRALIVTMHHHRPSRRTLFEILTRFLICFYKPHSCCTFPQTLVFKNTKTLFTGQLEKVGSGFESGGAAVLPLWGCCPASAPPCTVLCCPTLHRSRCRLTRGVR